MYLFMQNVYRKKYYVYFHQLLLIKLIKILQKELMPAQQERANVESFQQLAASLAVRLDRGESFV